MKVLLELKIPRVMLVRNASEILVIKNQNF